MPKSTSINMLFLNITAMAVEASNVTAIRMYIQHQVESFIFLGRLMPITAKKKKMAKADINTVSIFSHRLLRIIFKTRHFHLKVFKGNFAMLIKSYHGCAYMRVSLIHMKTRETLSEVLSAAEENFRKAAVQNPAFVAFPEYFSVPGFIEKYSSAEEIHRLTYEPTIRFLKAASERYPNIYLIGGTFIEKIGGAYYNTCTVWKAGEQVAVYRKRNLIKMEEQLGIAKADSPLVLETKHCKIGILICADVFDQNAVEETVRLGAEIIFLPVAALYAHPDVMGHPLSEKIASEHRLIIAKIGNVRSGAKGGRSAFIAPWGVTCEVDDGLEDVVLTADLNLAELRNLRKRAL